MLYKNLAFIKSNLSGSLIRGLYIIMVDILSSPYLRSCILGWSLIHVRILVMVDIHSSPYLKFYILGGSLIQWL